MQMKNTLSDALHVILVLAVAVGSVAATCKTFPAGLRAEAAVYPPSEDRAKSGPSEAKIYEPVAQDMSLTGDAACDAKTTESTIPRSNAVALSAELKGFFKDNPGVLPD
jgi:hypothetical protein